MRPCGATVGTVAQSGDSRRPSRPIGPICPTAPAETTMMGNRRFRRLKPIRGRLPPAGLPEYFLYEGALMRPGERSARGWNQRRDSVSQTAREAAAAERRRLRPK